MIKKLYDIFIFKYPKLVLAVVFAIIATLGYYATKLDIDASAETILVDNDKDLLFAREMGKRFHSPDFLVVTFTPKNETLLSQNNVNTIKKLSSDFAKIEGVSSITSMLTVPLVESPIKPISSLVDGVQTLETKQFDNKLAQKELTTSPLYSSNLVSKDFKTAAIIISLKRDNQYYSLLNKRNLLLEKERDGNITKDEKAQLKQTVQEFKAYRNIVREKDHHRIESIKSILKTNRDQGELFLGGVSMISNDIIGFVKSDLKIYGSVLLALLTFVLWFVFRQLRWVLIPIIISILSIVTTAGLLGFFEWEVTVVSSNFIAMQLIITLSIVVYLIVRYRELNELYPHASKYQLALDTMLSKLNPSFFSVATIVAGFSSLVLSGIEPVKNLGLMMSAGAILAFIVIFVAFPALLVLLPKQVDYHAGDMFVEKMIKKIANLVKNHGKIIVITALLVVVFSTTGAKRLIVENSFINYFKQSTDIYKGMEEIDKNLGGTTPLDIILTFSDNKQQNIKTQNQPSSDDIFDDFDAEFQQSQNDPQYWFSQDKIDTILAVHNYMESLPQVGKVLSLGSVIKIGERLNDNKPLDGITLALLYLKMPDKYKDLIITPYVDIKDNQARISTRIVDSNPDLRRDELIKKIEHDLPKVINNSNISFKLSNLMILYNNMLQSLFESQIKTLGTAMAIIFVMFALSFRSIKTAILALLANIIPISIVFGIMGWFKIPLDVMTITIASIAMGIGVDQSIHYTHRFHEEFLKSRNYKKAMELTHSSVAHAITYTSFAIIIGFSVLIFSNLIPTIYFGLLTVVAMLGVWVSTVMLLPKLYLLFNPYGKEK